MNSFGILATIALVVWIVLALTLLAALAYVFPSVRRLQRLLPRLERLVRKLDRRAEPILVHLERSADNVEYVSTALRADVESIGEAVERGTRSVHRMLRMAEERASEINGFLEVVQEEAEETFVSTASALRAIRGGNRRRRGRRSA